MEVLMVFNGNPYDGTDVTWNGLRLAEQLVNLGTDLAVFLVNDAVDLARGAAKPPEGYFDLGEILRKLIEEDVPVKVCGTCKVRCGLYKGEPYFEGAQEATIAEFAEWVRAAEKIITF